jgi:hypothetical protein
MINELLMLERNTYQARLALIEAKHVDDTERTGGLCAECVRPSPCPTLLIARGLMKPSGE